MCHRVSEVQPRVDHGHHRLKPDNLTQSMINLITLRYRTAVISVTTVFPALFCAAIFFMLLQSPVLDCNYYMGDTHAQQRINEWEKKLLVLQHYRQYLYLLNKSNAITASILITLLVYKCNNRCIFNHLNIMKIRLCIMSLVKTT